MVADIDVDALMRARWAMALGERLSTEKVLERGTEDMWMTLMDTSTSARQFIFSVRDGMCMQPLSSLRYC